MTKHDLAEWMYGLNRELIECNPSESEYALEHFCEIQAEQEELDEAIKAAGFTFEEIETLALL
tara:strand:- start:1416 stop:1604 length:189 start_codon:yes stop_codon:yes gene_type:complete